MITNWLKKEVMLETVKRRINCWIIKDYTTSKLFTNGTTHDLSKRTDI